MDVLITLFKNNMAIGLLGLFVILGFLVWIIYRSRQNYQQDFGDLETEDFSYFEDNDPLNSAEQRHDSDNKKTTNSAEAIFGTSSEFNHHLEIADVDPALQDPYLVDEIAIPQLGDPILTAIPTDPIQTPIEKPQQRPRTLIISLSVKAIDEQGFSNQDIVNSMQQLGLHYGNMRIFHHYGLEMNAQNPAVFSIANMVEPGDFSNLDSAHFFCPGLVLFMQLPNQLSGRVAFELMFNHAQRLTALLQAQLECDKHQRLDTQRIEEIRYDIDYFEANI